MSNRTFEIGTLPRIDDALGSLPSGFDWPRSRPICHARVLTRSEAGFARVGGLDNIDEHEKAHELGSDRPGRSFDSAGAGRHMMEPRTDPHLRAKLAFAEQVAESVNAGAGQDTFSRFVVVAPPKIAAAIRRALSGEAASRLAAEHHADLVKLPEAELRDRLSALELPAAADDVIGTPTRYAAARCRSLLPSALIPFRQFDGVVADAIARDLLAFARILGRP